VSGGGTEDGWVERENNWELGARPGRVLDASFGRERHRPHYCGAERPYQPPHRGIKRTLTSL